MKLPPLTPNSDRTSPPRMLERRFITVSGVAVTSYLLLLLYYHNAIPYHWSRLVDLSLWLVIAHMLFLISGNMARSLTLFLTLFGLFHWANQWKIFNFGTILFPTDCLVPFQMLQSAIDIDFHLLLILLLPGIFIFLLYPVTLQKLLRTGILAALSWTIFLVISPLSAKLQESFGWSAYNNQNAAKSGLLAYTIISSAASKYRISHLPDSAAFHAALEKVQRDNLLLFTKKPSSLPPLVITIQMESFFNPMDSMSIEDCANTVYLTELNSAFKKLIVPTFGGGSAATAFEVMCGLPANLLDERAGSEFGSLIQQPVRCLPKILSEMQFETIAIYPFSPEFFNESESYKNTGFSTILRPSRLNNMAYDGLFLSDESLFSYALEQIKEHSDSPLYLHIETAAGHFPAFLDHDIHPPIVTCKDPQTATALNRIYYSYIALKDFVAKAMSYRPDAIILAYGDHLPFSDRYLREVHDTASPVRYTVPLLAMNLELPGRVFPAYLLPHYLVTENFRTSRSPLLRPLPDHPHAVIDDKGNIATCSKDFELQHCYENRSKQDAYAVILRHFLASSSEIRGSIPELHR